MRGVSVRGVSVRGVGVRGVGVVAMGVVAMVSHRRPKRVSQSLGPPLEPTTAKRRLSQLSRAVSSISMKRCELAAERVTRISKSAHMLQRV